MRNYLTFIQTTGAVNVSTIDCDIASHDSQKASLLNDFNAQRNPFKRAGYLNP